MEDKELLKNFKEIRIGLENLNRLLYMVASCFFDFEEEESGELSKDITDIYPLKSIKGSEDLDFPFYV